MEKLYFGYDSVENKESLGKMKLKSHIMHKGTRGKKITQRQQRVNVFEIPSCRTFILQKDKVFLLKEMGLYFTCEVILLLIPFIETR